MGLRRRQRRLTAEIKIDRHKWKALDDYYIENKWELNQRIWRCNGCKEYYLAHNYTRDTHRKERGYKSTLCHACNRLKRFDPVLEEFKEHAIMYWDKKQKEVDEKKNIPRRIPKEYHKTRYYNEIKKKLMNKTEQKEILSQIKGDYNELVEEMEALGLNVVRKDSNVLKSFSDKPIKVAKKLKKYIATTFADPKLIEMSVNSRKKELDKRPRNHINKYGIAMSIGITVEQLDKILEADLELNGEVVIQGLLRGVVDLHNSYVSNLALSNNAGSIKYLEKFGDKKQWGDKQDLEGDALLINSKTLESVLLHLTQDKLTPEIEMDYIEIENIGGGEEEKNND